MLRLLAAMHGATPVVIDVADRDDFGVPARDRLERALEELDREWDGEPNAQNVMITDEGPVLIDWDTALIAPPERDLWMLTSDGDDLGLDAYRDITGQVPNPTP